jgi:glycosyltransferase involved in cell wall biosynthesis
MSKKSLSVVMTARNEAQNLAPAVEVSRQALTGLFEDYEIIVVNDASTDATALVADTLAGTYPSIRVLHQARRGGFARAYRRGVAEAKMTYVGLVTGDNEIAPESVRAIFEAVGSADVVVPYHGNQGDRPLLRQMVSRVFTGSVATIFGLPLRYFQGPCVYVTEWAQSLPGTTDGFALLTDMLIRTIKAGHSYVEVPMYTQRRAYGRSTALTFHNVRTAIGTVWSLWRDIYIRRQPVPGSRMTSRRRVWD